MLHLLVYLLEYMKMHGPGNIKFIIVYLFWGTLLVAQLVETLRYKPEGRGFDSRLCH
jgi:hypothetical protein